MVNLFFLSVVINCKEADGTSDRRSVLYLNV